jgi:hypothetical protein
VNSSTPNVPLVDSNGNPQGSVNITLSSNQTFPGVAVGPPASPPPNPPSSGPYVVVSPPISITMNNNQTTNLTVTITLPINASSSLDNMCLAYYDVNASAWECVSCLSRTNSSNGTIMVTGTSPHLTTFGVLFYNSDSHHQPCGSYHYEYLITALALIGFFIVFGLAICYFPPLTAWFYGHEGMRVRELQRTMKSKEYQAEINQPVAATALPLSEITASDQGQSFFNLPVVTSEDQL